MIKTGRSAVKPQQTKPWINDFGRNILYASDGKTTKDVLWKTQIIHFIAHCIDESPGV